MTTRQSPSEVAERLEELLLIHEGNRAVLGLLLCPEPYLEGLRTALKPQLATLPPEVVELKVLRGEDDDARWLSWANHARNLWLRTHRLVLLVVTSPEALREARRLANDLTVAPDLFGEVGPGGEPKSVSEAEVAIRAWTAERCRYVQLVAGLERRSGARVELETLYVPLVNWSGVHSAGKPPFLGLVGELGSGRTTALRWLARRYALGDADPLHIGPAVPLFIELSEYVLSIEWRKLSLEEFLARRLERAISWPSGELGEASRGALLILDGVDELSSELDRSRLLAEAARMIEQSRLKGVVFSISRAGVSEAEEALGDRVGWRALPPLGVPEASAVLLRIRAAYGREDPEPLVARDEGVAPLLACPSAIMALLAVARVRTLWPPLKRGELWSKFVESSALRADSSTFRDHEPDREIELTVDRAQLRQVLERVAWRMVAFGWHFFTDEMWDIAVAEALERPLEREQSSQLANLLHAGLLHAGFVRGQPLVSVGRTSDVRGWTFTLPEIRDHLAASALIHPWTVVDEDGQSVLLSRWSGAFARSVELIYLEGRDVDAWLQRLMASIDSRFNSKHPLHRRDATRHAPALLQDILDHVPLSPALTQALQERILLLSADPEPTP